MQTATVSPMPPLTDTNELLRRIDQTTTMIFHWVRIGVVVIVLLLALVAVGF